MLAVETVSVRAAATSLLDRAAVSALGAAVVVGGLRQGGFYAADAGLVLALVAVAVAARFAAGAERRSGPAAACAAALLVLAGWTVLSAALHGDPANGIAPAAVTCAPTPCTTVTTGGPLGNASAPRCVEITTPSTSVRRC